MRAELAGVSVAGVETCIEASGLRLLFDIGVCSRRAVGQPVVAVSHGHLDHLGAITQHAARRALMGMSEGVYVVPRAVAGRVEALFEAAGELDGQRIPRRVVPLSPGEEYQLSGTRWLRPFPTYHRVPSQGYTVWERRHRLRPEFRHEPGPRLGELRRQGIVLDEAYEAPLVSFSGDTRVEALDDDIVRQTQLLIVEATFLDDRVSVAEAREMGHIHLDELVERADSLPARIVLSHFSARYRDEDVRRILVERLPESLRERVQVLQRGAVREL